MGYKTPVTEDEADAEAVRRTKESGSQVFVPVEQEPGAWEVKAEAPEKVGKLRSLGRALRDGAWG